LKSLSGGAPKSKNRNRSPILCGKGRANRGKRFAREYDFFYETAGAGYFDRQKTTIKEE